VPRTLIGVVLALAASALPAQDFGTPEPVWTLRVASGPVAPGQPFTVTAEITLPEGYYQDVDSPFLRFEPVGATVLSRASSVPRLREGKESYTGKFTLTRTVVGGTLGHPVSWSAGWQICRESGVCLLPAEKTLTLELTVGGGGPDRPPSWAWTSGERCWVPSSAVCS